jgi:hypothetical protein
MTAIPNPVHTIAALIDRHHEEQEAAQPPRYHFGASQLGHHCERYLWLNFRWAVKQSFEGRMLRLFRRGQNEEEIIAADLRAIGIEIVTHDSDGIQMRVDFGAHVSGSLDGVIRSGVPEAPEKPHVCEMKTHNKRSFDDLVKKGVKESKPQHWAQMQAYMLGTQIDRALYVAVCKDDDRLYTERVRLEAQQAKRLVDRAQRIATADRMPEPISADPTWYQCKMCPAHDFCHVGHKATSISCRTCSHATPKDDSTWHCARWDAEIPQANQPVGCRAHVLHPDLVPWQLEGGDGINAVYHINGDSVTNGEGGASSWEIIAHA